MSIKQLIAFHDKNEIYKANFETSWLQSNVNHACWWAIDYFHLVVSLLGM
jgi:hypothetical protein